MRLIVRPETEAGPSDPDVDAAWLEEARRRGREIDADQVELVPADRIFRALEASLRK